MLINEASPIADLGLSTRTRNALARRYITTVGGLTARNGWELLDIPNFGRVAYREVVTALAKHGLELKPTPSDWPPLPKVE